MLNGNMKRESMKASIEDTRESDLVSFASQLLVKKNAGRTLLD